MFVFTDLSFTKYDISVRTAQKTPLFIQLLRKHACLQSRYSVTAVSAGFTVLALS
jgi:hypothetical protein